MGHAVYSSLTQERIFKQFVEACSRKGQGIRLNYTHDRKGCPGVIAKERRIYKGVSANVDFYSGFVYSMLNILLELYTPILQWREL